MGEHTTCYNCFKEKGRADVCPHCGYSERDSAGKYPLALPAGTILDGKYVVGRVLGQGGFGATYVSQDYITKKLVAIKEYLPVEMVTRSATYDLIVYGEQHKENFQYGKSCFLEEAKTLAKLKGDPNIVEVFSFFEEHNTAYFSMEYIEGKSLQQVVKEHGGRLNVDEANRLLAPVMEAVGHVHEKGIIHRDIAPDNIMINADGVGNQYELVIQQQKRNFYQLCFLNRDRSSCKEQYT